MIENQVAIVGAVAGLILGLVGGVVGTYYEVSRATPGPHRRNAIQTAFLAWVAVLLLGAGLIWLPTPYAQLVFIPFVILLWILRRTRRR